MLRFSVARRLLKTWHRCYNNRRERTPSSLLESIDTPPPKRGLWRSWFIILILLPIVYYILFLGGENKYEEYSVRVQNKIQEPPPLRVERPKYRQDVEENAIEDPPSERPKMTEKPQKLDSSKASYYQIQPPQAHNAPPNDGKPIETSKIVYQAEQNSTAVAKFDPNNTIQARIPAKNKKSPVLPSKPEKDILFVCVPKHTEERSVFSKNISVLLEYRQKLIKGGYYTPSKCLARHKIAVLVPYRNRRTNLAVFLNNIHPFLIDQAIEYRIFIIEQYGKEPFNKGRLFNAGYTEALKYGKWGCIVFHDVDLVPTDAKILYSCPTWPRHMAPTIVGKQNNPTYKSQFGGVTSMTVKQYKTVNGYSNMYWGWGGEDTDMFWRLKAAGLPIVRYSKTVAIYLAMPHKQEPDDPIRRQLSNHAMERYKTDGLSNLVYRLLSVKLYQTFTHLLVDINPMHENITELRTKWS